MASRSTVQRLGAAILGASLVLMSALPAAADTPKVKPFDGADEPGMGLYLERGGVLLDGDKGKAGVQAFNASLIGLKLTDGAESETAQAYCVELPTPLEDTTELEEVQWGEHPNEKFTEKAGYVNWVLQHSYPKLSADEAVELYGFGEVKNSILIVAAQAAVWHFSDDVDLREEDSTTEDEDVGNGTVDELVYKIYDYLVTKAEDLDEPRPTLEVAPKELAGKAGEKIGPFVVSTTADVVVVTAEVPAGVTLTDQTGKVLGAVDEEQVGIAAETKTAEVWVDVAAGTEPGGFEFTVSADAELRSGRLFVASSPDKQTQSLVIAKSEKVSVEDVAKVSWVEGPRATTPSATTSTPTPTTETTTTTAPTSTTVPAGGGGDDLANTGASILVPLLIGLGLLGAGVGALLFLRRKRSA